MLVKRIRAVAVTLAMVIGAGTMTAVAAPLLRSQDAIEPETAITESPSEAFPAEEGTESVTETAEEATEVVTETVQDDDSDAGGEDAARDGKTRPAKDKARPAKSGKRTPAKGEESKDEGTGPPAHAKGHGNSHGRAVSEAARGETPPVGACRNHGHWVSSVAKGLGSCDDNPKGAKSSD